MKKSIAIIGDYHNHIALNSIIESINHANLFLGTDTSCQWIDTEVLSSGNVEATLGNYDGIWSAPGSPFKNLSGTLEAIKYARVNKVPHLATCAGFQHSVIEYARNVAGFQSAQHAEYASSSEFMFIHKLACSLKGTKGQVFLSNNSYARKIYGTDSITGEYFCSYGLNEDFNHVFADSDFIISGTDPNGSIRILELNDHPFFIATVFVPQVDSSPNSPNPLITEFVRKVNSI